MTQEELKSKNKRANPSKLSNASGTTANDSLGHLNASESSKTVRHDVNGPDLTNFTQIVPISEGFVHQSMGYPQKLYRQSIVHEVQHNSRSDRGMHQRTSTNPFIDSFL